MRDDVHKELGLACWRALDEGALAIELQEAGFSMVRERTYPAIYKGVRVGDYRPDVIVDNEVVIEIKSVERFDPGFLAQMLTYLRITGMTVGLILNFDRPALRDGIKRVVL